jgi:hypothetical protein
MPTKETRPWLSLQEVDDARTKEARTEKARRHRLEKPSDPTAPGAVTIPEPTLAAPAGTPPRCGWCGEPAVRLGPVDAFWPPREQPLIVSWSCAGHLFWLSLAQEV